MAGRLALYLSGKLREGSRKFNAEKRPKIPEK
jgi:hypothetical protein